MRSGFSDEGLGIQATQEEDGTVEGTHVEFESLLVGGSKSEKYDTIYYKWGDSRADQTEIHDRQGLRGLAEEEPRSLSWLAKAVYLNEKVGFAGEESR